MGRATSSYCYRLIDKYIEEIESSKNKITKNFNDMDLENASVQRDIYDVVMEMTKYCDDLISILKSYSFE